MTVALTSEPNSMEAERTRLHQPKRLDLAGWAKTPGPWILTTYFAEGLPYSLVHKIAGEYLVSVKASAVIVGLVGLAYLPWNGKFLWAPFVDRFGSTKTWMVGAQLGLCVATLFVAAFAAVFVPWAFAIGILLIAFFAATNDIAVDGYYLRRLEDKEQAGYSGLRVGAYRAALMVGGGAIAGLGGTAGFPVAFTVCAAILGVLAVAHAFTLRNDTRIKAPTALKKVVSEAARTFFARKGIVWGMAVIILYRAGDQLLFAMHSPFLASLGLGTATRALINGTFGTIASIAGSIVGGVLIARFSFRKLFLPITILQASAILGYAALSITTPAEGATPLSIITAVILFEQFVAGIGTAAFMVFIMKLCGGEQRATQFAFASSIMSIGLAIASVGSGFLFVSVDPAMYFVIAFAAAMPGVLAAAVAQRRVAGL